MKRTWLNGLAIVVSLVVVLSACRKKDAPLPDNTVKFEANEQGIAEATASINVKLLLDRATSAEAPVTIQLTPSAGLDYGTEFTTTPAATGGVLTVPVLSGASEVIFTVSKVPGALFYGDEKISFKLTSASNGVILSPTNNEFTLNFAEIISAGTTIVGQGGGATYGNKVFFDLSANTQVPVLRTKWDLGFYTGDDFRVTVNSSTLMMAKQINKNDLNLVTADDTLGFSSDVVFNQMEPGAATLGYIDYPTGDLTRTAIAAVSATPTENKVYIVNRGNGIGSPAPARGWKKIRIIRNGSGGYTLQHADITASTFTSVEITKDPAYFFKYVSFETGATEVEPQKTKWDLAWTYFTNTTFFNSFEVAYPFQDIVIQNRNVQVARVMIATKSYESFAEADLPSLEWNSTQVGIGADWRSGGGPGVTPAVRVDRFYVLKDGDGNYYKIRFTGFTLNGERGFPAFEYVLLKRG
ncbi:MAG: HmuY family protein [Chitinophagaceae bacterium]